MLRPHGLRGEIGVEPLTDFMERFSAGAALFLEDGRELIIESVRGAGEKLLVSFQGLEDRESSGRLTGLYLTIPRAKAIELPAGEYYDFQLEGCIVLDHESGEELGVIVELQRGSAQDRLLVRTTADEERLVPFVSEFIRDVDTEGGIVRVRSMPGLFE